MSAVSRVFGWWAGELAALVPGPVKRALAPARPRLSVIPRDGDADLSVERGGRSRPLGALSALSEDRLARLARAVARHRLEVVLCLPAARVVTRPVTLPLAAEEDVAGVLGYEIDRLTPFRAAELYFTHRLAARRAEAQRLEVVLTFAPRADLDPLREGLAEIGLPPARIDVLEPDGTLRGLDLLPGPGGARWRPAHRLGVGLAALLAALLAAWGLLALERLEDRRDDLRAAVTEARRAAIAAQDRALAASGTETAETAAYRFKRAAPPAVEILAEITRLLPDDTWIDQFGYDGRALDLGGVSANASALIERFERHRRFETPVFRAPITRGREDGLERFVLSVEVVAGPEGAR